MLLLLTALAPPPNAAPIVIQEAEAAKEQIARLLHAYLHRWRDPSKSRGLVGKQLHEAFYLATIGAEEAFVCQSQRLRLA